VNRSLGSDNISENIEPLSEDAQEGRFKAVAEEDTDQFLRDNKNTNYKTKSDMKIFTDWLRTQALVSGRKNIPR
jgi:hypothetical protein